MKTYTEQYEVTTFEQAQLLQLRGLSVKTSDCYFDKLTGKITFGTLSGIDLKGAVQRFIPLWSAGRLIFLMVNYSNRCHSLTIVRGRCNIEYITAVMDGVLKYDFNFCKVEKDYE